MIEAGHSNAGCYPLGRLYDEAALVEERQNNKIVTESQILQTAIHSIMAKAARTQFSKLIKQLNVRTRPHEGLFDKDT